MPNAVQIAQLYAKIGADASDFNKALQNVDKNLSTTGKAMAGLQSAATAAFKVGAAVTATFAAAVGVSVKAASDMEQGVADIGAMMSLTAGDVVKLQDHILELGLSPTLKVSATEAAEAVMALGTAGLSMGQIMGGASEATVLLANATGAQFGSAANIATDVMAQFNITAADMQSAVNQIAGVAVASKFDIDDYRLAIAQAGGVAGAVGVSFEDFNAAIAATSSSFDKGSDAGTSFKTFLQRLVPATEPAKGAMKDLGLLTEDGGSKFFDASGKMKGMEEIAGLLQTAFIGLSDAQKIDTASTIFGTDAWRTALALAKGGTPIITKMKGEIGKVDAENLAAQRMNTFAGAMEIAWGVIDTLSISIGNEFLPVLRPLVEQFTELAQKHGPAVIAFFGQVAEKMAGWIQKTKDAVSSGMGPFVEKLKSIWDAGVKVRDLLATFIESFTATLMPVTNAIAKFMGWQDVLTAVGLLLAGPILAAIGGFIAALWPVLVVVAQVTAAVAALRWAWENDFLSIRTFTQNTLQKISDWFFEESGIWKGTLEKTLDYLSWWANGGWKNSIYFPIRSWFYEIRSEFSTWSLWTRNKFAEWVQDVYDKIAGWKNDAARVFANWKDIVITSFNGWINPIKKSVTDWATVTGSSIERWVGNAAKGFREFKDDAIERFKQTFDWFKPNEWLQKGKDIVQGLWDGAKEIWRNFKNWWDGLWQTLTGTVDVKLRIGSPSKVMEQRGAWAIEGFAKGAEKMLPKAFDVMDSLSTGLTSSVNVAAGDFAFAGASSSAPTSDPQMAENNALLRQLIAALQAKNMSPNITVQGGRGEDLSQLVSMTSGLRA